MVYSRNIGTQWVIRHYEMKPRYICPPSCSCRQSQKDIHLRPLVVLVHKLSIISFGVHIMPFWSVCWLTWTYTVIKSASYVFLLYWWGSQIFVIAYSIVQNWTEQWAWNLCKILKPLLYQKKNVGIMNSNATKIVAAMEGTLRSCSKLQFQWIWSSLVRSIWFGSSLSVGSLKREWGRLVIMPTRWLSRRRQERVDNKVLQLGNFGRWPLVIYVTEDSGTLEGGH
jgi:hypothetical protein